MEVSVFATWLDTTFASFDLAALSFMHNLAVAAGDVLTPFMHLVSLFGKEGIFSVILGIVLLLPKKTRKTGFTVLMAIIISTLITNVTLKPLVARPRPFVSYDYVAEWWNFVGSSKESDLSFPSGHVTIITSSLTAFCLAAGEWAKKKWHVWLPAGTMIVLMCISRMYLMMHYPTDVMGGLAVGLISGFFGYLIISSIHKLIKSKRNKAK